MTYEKACETLGITKETSLEEAKHKYKKLSMQCHPDKGGTTSLFCLIKEAYDVVKKYKTTNNQENNQQHNQHQQQKEKQKQNHQQYEYNKSNNNKQKNNNCWQDIIKNKDFIVPLKIIERIIRENKTIPVHYQNINVNISPEDLKNYNIKGESKGEIRITTYAHPLLRMLHLFPKNKNVAHCKTTNAENNTCHFLCKLNCELPKGYHTITIRFNQHKTTFNADTSQINSSTIVNRTMRIMKNLVIDLSIELKATFK